MRLHNSHCFKLTQKSACYSEFANQWQKKLLQLNQMCLRVWNENVRSYCNRCITICKSNINHSYVPSACIWQHLQILLFSLSCFQSLCFDSEDLLISWVLMMAAIDDIPMNWNGNWLYTYRKNVLTSRRAFCLKKFWIWFFSKLSALTAFWRKSFLEDIEFQASRRSNILIKKWYSFLPKLKFDSKNLVFWKQ